MQSSPLEQSVASRLSNLDWTGIHESLRDHGYALTPAVLPAEECSSLAAMYASDGNFRSHIIMSRYRFGRGDYKYFHYPLPPIVQQIREHSYAHLAPIANEWHRALNLSAIFPKRLSDFLAICKRAKQTRATPLLLHYETGDFNCLHQDIYGTVAFPLQMTCFLNQPGVDYQGGEFVLVEQQPRAQSRAEVILPAQGEIVIFATRYRPVKGTRGYDRTALRHGVSRVRSGIRFTLGVIFHDSQ